MFKIPDWGEDIPKTNVNFGKKAKKRKDATITTPDKTANKGDKKAIKSNKTNNWTSKNNIVNKNKSINVNKSVNKNQPAILSNGRPENVVKFNKKLKKINKNNQRNNFVGNNNKPKKRKYTDHVNTENQNETEDNTVSKRQNIANNNGEPKKKKKKPNNANKIQKDKNNSALKLNKVNSNKKSTPSKDDSDNDNKVVLHEKRVPVDPKKEKIRKMLEQNKKNVTETDSSNNLRNRMLQKLKAAQFRYLNEKLYTSSGSEAMQLFKADPAAFQTYHEGYQQQLKKWPVNPLDVIVKKILKMPKSHIIADMGCGEASLAKRVPHAVRSFDLVATAPGVEECDMAHTPLLAASVDVAVYCLALMGTELTQYIVEANRILKQGGHLLIAEVESRFDDVEAFAHEVEKLGFKLKNLDKTHQVFFFLQFVKNRDPPAKKNKRPALSLKPCLYKKR